MSGPALLSVDNLTVTYETRKGLLKALDNVSFAVHPGEALALVGESGSGKSTIALATMGLLGPEAAISGGILFDGRDLSRLASEERRKVRGRDISVVFQDPFTSLNPSLPIGLQVAEPLMEHRSLPRGEAMQLAIAALSEVGLPRPESLVGAYPHQLSGGMQQRVLIAAALVCDPKLVVLDEPTTALDVTVEARILDLLAAIRRSRGIGMLFITHNLGVVNKIADRVCVIYAGRIVEIGGKNDVFGAPSHPYTKGLIASLPRLSAHERRARLAPIGGRFPDLTALPPGCVFAPRCPFAEAKCQEPQAFVSLGNGQAARCWKSEALGSIGWATANDNAKSPRARELGGDFAVRDLSKVYEIAGTRGAIRWKRRFGLPWPVIGRHELRAVDGVSFTISGGEVLGLVGESGSGKSTLARLAIRLIEPNSGEIIFNGKDVRDLRGASLKSFRQAVQIVFQNPDSSLNPRRTVGNAVARAVKVHTAISAVRRRNHVENSAGSSRAS